MSAPPSPALQASSKLLRVVSALVAQVDPVKGGRAGAMRDLAEEVREVLEESGGALPETTRPLLETVVETLSAATTTLPFPSAIPLITKLSSAADLILSSPPSTPPISLLPAELFSRIVHFCQDDDLRLRQNTNLALSRTSRSFYLAARPFLASKPHLWTPGQLIRFAHKIEGSAEAKQAVRSLTTDFRTQDLTWKGSSASWVGRRFLPLVEKLLKTTQLTTLRMSFDDGSEGSVWEGRDSRGGYLTLGAALTHDEDSISWMWNITDDVPHLEIPMPNSVCEDEIVVLALISAASSPLRQSLWIGKDSLPHTFSHTLLHRDLLAAQVARQNPKSSSGASPPVSFSLNRLSVFACPFVVFYPADFLALITPPAGSTTPHTLRHLEVSFLIRNPIEDGEDCEALTSIFALLSPSLGHLALRIINPDDRTAMGVSWALSEVLGKCVSSCARLESLSLGGHLTEHAYQDLEKLGRLNHLVTRPTSHYFNEYEFKDIALPPCLRSLTFSSWDNFAFDTVSTMWYDEMLWSCGRVGATFVEDKRPKETTWLASSEAA